MAERNKLLLQIYADVTGREFKQAAAPFTSALGAAMFGALAAGAAEGGYNTVTEAAQHMAPAGAISYKPDARYHALYGQLMTEYRRLHDYFGRGQNGTRILANGDSRIRSRRAVTQWSGTCQIKWHPREDRRAPTGGWLNVERAAHDGRAFAHAD